MVHTTRLTSGRNGECKRVTVLSGLLLPLAGVGLDPEEVQELLTALETWLYAVLQPCDGTLLQVASERLGVVCGAPVAQEDHAIRAVLAALMLQQQWAALAQALSLGSALHLGLHTGAVVVEPTHPAAPTPLTVVGEVPRVATLLAQQAPRTLGW